MSGEPPKKTQPTREERAAAREAARAAAPPAPAPTTRSSKRGQVAPAAETVAAESPKKEPKRTTRRKTPAEKAASALETQVRAELTTLGSDIQVGLMVGLVTEAQALDPASTVSDLVPVLVEKIGESYPIPEAQATLDEAGFEAERSDLVATAVQVLIDRRTAAAAAVPAGSAAAAAQAAQAAQEAPAAPPTPFAAAEVAAAVTSAAVTAALSPALQQVVPPSQAASQRMTEVLRVKTEKEASQREEDEEEEVEPSQGAAPMSQESLPPALTPPAPIMEEEPQAGAFAITYYTVNSSLPGDLGDRMNILAPSMGVMGFPWTVLKAQGDRGVQIKAFVVAQLPPGAVEGSTFDLTTGELDRVAGLGLLVAYPGLTGTPNVKILEYGTRLDLQGADDDGFTVDACLDFAIGSIAQAVKAGLGETTLLRYARKNQPTASTEYMNTLGTLAAKGFAFSAYTAMGEDALYGASKTEPGVEIERVSLDPSKPGAERVIYTYREEATGREKTFDFPDVMQFGVKTVVPRRGLRAATTVEMVARVKTIVSPTAGDITIPSPEQQDQDKTAPRRGGTRRKRRGSRRA